MHDWDTGEENEEGKEKHVAVYTDVVSGMINRSTWSLTETKVLFDRLCGQRVSDVRMPCRRRRTRR